MNEEIRFSLLTANSTAAIFQIEGYINFDTSEELFEFISKVLREHQSTLLIFNVEDVEYVSSAGLGVFMSLVEEVESRGGKVVLVAPSVGFSRVMELTGALGYFIICQSMQEAQIVLSDL